MTGPWECDDEAADAQDDYLCHQADIDRDLGGTGTSGMLYRDEVGL